MCMTIYGKRGKYAKKDITVYKTVLFMNRQKCSSVYQLYHYLRDRVQKRVRIKPRFNYTSRNGDKYEIYQGYHAYTKKEYASLVCDQWERVARFVIPRGTRYFENGAYTASERIVFKGYCR